MLKRSESDAPVRENRDPSSLRANNQRIAKPVPPMTAASCVEGILKNDRSVLARAITLIESSRVADRQVAEEIFERCSPAAGNSIRIGVTGIPGGGKSSLIDALGKHLVRERGENIAVLAIDPSSQLAGGSILGDKTRMAFLASSDMAFIRPSPARSARGGVARNTREAIVLCEAAGYRNIVVETVGAGQSEAAVSGMVDLLILVTLAGTGDELQGIKRGLMELADVVVVNKADGDNIKSAENARTEAANALQLLAASPSGWTPGAITCSAHTGRGVAALWSCILEHNAVTKGTQWFEQNRREQALGAMRDGIELGLMQMFQTNPVVQRRMSELEQKVLAGSMTPLAAARELLALFASK